MTNPQPGHRHYIRSSLVEACLVVILAFGHPIQAEELTWEYSVQVSATIQSHPPALLFSWPQDVATPPDFYTVSRKAPNARQWGTPTILPGSSTNYLDTDVTPGVVYEYQFYKSTPDHVGYGYISAGIALPAIENRGKIILLVDQTFASNLAVELARLQQDLVGDGWIVQRHDIPRQASVPSVKTIVKAEYDADPANVKALFLLGRIPVPYSGEMAPDGHPAEHLGAWPADVFYGDLDGLWTDDTVSNLSSVFPRNHNLPGDGKYDQSEIPSEVDLQVGRVDLANMPGFETNGLPSFPTEGELLRRYLNKDHNYRHKHFSLPARGIVYNATGDRDGEAFAASAWRNYAPLLGPSSIRSVGIGEFLPILRTNGYLWAYAASGGAPAELGGLGGTRPYWYYQSGTSLDLVEMDIQTAFVMLLGSSLGDWDEQDNIMRAVLATPTYGLASVYAGRPHWYFHAMGVGETLGYCAQLTQNNHASGLYRNQSNNFAGFAHIALLGDPTLRLHTVAPASALQAVYLKEGVQLSWSRSVEEVEGYYVYRAIDEAGPFERLTPSVVRTSTFLDSSNLPGIRTYMVRAVKLQTSPSGSYYNLSQGVFVTITAPPTVRFASSGDVALSMSATPRRVYRVLWSHSLTNADWTPLSQDMLATGSSITCSITPGGAVSGNGWIPTNATPLKGTVIWVDDSLPSGAQPGWDSTWNWVSNNPAPYSGTVASQSTGSGLYQQYFSSASATLAVSTNDALVAAVYIDPENPPREIMLQWNDGTSWEHRAFWGDNLITYGANGTAGRFYKGPLPPAGRWAMLHVPAEEVALVGATVSGLAFSQYDGRATWDYAGKQPFPSGPATNTTPAAIASQRFFKVLVLP